MQQFDAGRFWQSLSSALTAIFNLVGVNQDPSTNVAISSAGPVPWAPVGTQQATWAPVGTQQVTQNWWNNFQSTSNQQWATTQQSDAASWQNTQNSQNTLWAPQTTQNWQNANTVPNQNLSPNQSINTNTLQPELIPRKLLFGNADYSSVQLSPNGQYITWFAPIGTARNIWITSASTPPPPARPLTFNNRSIGWYMWTYDNETLLYGDDNDGDENNRLYALNVVSNQTRVLYSQKDVSAEILATSRRRPNEVIISINERDPRFGDAYLLNLATGQKSILFENTLGFGSLLFDRQFQLRLVTKEKSDGGIDYLRRTLENQWVNYRTIDKEDVSTSIVGWDATETKLYWVENINRDKLALVQRNFDNWNSTQDYRVMFESNDADVSSMMAFEIDSIPLTVSVEYLKEKVYILNQTIVPDFMAINQQLIEKYGLEPDNFFVSDMTLDTNRWLVIYSSDIVRSKRFLYNRQTKQLSFLLETMAELSRYKLVRMQPLEIPTRDGYKEVCYFSAPLQASAPYPLVLNVHGGPWARDSWGYDPMAQLLANRGYAVLSCNFRSSTGFGKKWINLGNGEWGKAMQNDLTDAVNWSIQQGLADPQRIAIFGGSYGGYAALAGLAFTPDLYACGVDLFGPANLETLLQAIPPTWETARASLIYRIGGDPNTEEGRRFLRSRSPLFFVDQMKRPLLIVQGANDVRVRRNESDAIVQALKNKGTTNLIYGLFPDEGHGFDRQENQLAFCAVAEKFLQKCLGGRAEPIGTDVQQSSLQVLEGSQNLYSRRRRRGTYV